MPPWALGRLRIVSGSGAKKTLGSPNCSPWRSWPCVALGYWFGPSRSSSSMASAFLLLCASTHARSPTGLEPGPKGTGLWPSSCLVQTAAATCLRQKMRHLYARLRCYDWHSRPWGPLVLSGRVEKRDQFFLRYEQTGKGILSDPGILKPSQLGWVPVPISSCHFLCSFFNFYSHSRASPKGSLNCPIILILFFPSGMNQLLKPWAWVGWDVIESES